MGQYLLDAERPVPGRLRAVSGDVVVVGAGIVGAAAARELAVRGVGVDAARPRRGVGRHDRARRGQRAVLGQGRRARSSSSRAPGSRVYDELEERLGEEARIRRKGALIVHPDAGAWAAEPARLERLRASPGARLLEPAEVRALEPALTGDVLGATPRSPATSSATRARSPGRWRARPRAAGATVAHGLRGRGGRRSRGGARDRRAHARRTARRRRGRARRRRRGARAARRAAPGLPLPLEPRKGQLVRLARARAGPRPPQGRRRLLPRARSRARTPALQVSTVVETTWEGDVLVGSSPRAARLRHRASTPAVSAAMVERAARAVPARCAALPRRGRLGRAAPVAARPPARDRAVARGAGPLARHRPRGRRRRARPGHRPPVAQLYSASRRVVDPAPFDPDRFTQRGS